QVSINWPRYTGYVYSDVVLLINSINDQIKEHVNSIPESDSSDIPGDNRMQRQKDVNNLGEMTVEGFNHSDAAFNEALGGVDFTRDRLHLQIKRDKNGVPLDIPLQDFEHIDLKGLTPIIIDITPLRTLPFQLGFLNR
ncbi:MAG: hypothetical protein KC713_04140, partial [Candidatus Omnitrophica bacterium]|nr:hypothetical protein [Candidatus Omnitrophota bacterium]